MTADLARDTLTRSAEDYLKAIFHLTGDGHPAATTELAAALRLAPASVSGMLRRLAEQDLVQHELYRGVTLTVEGRRIALKILRRHRLLEAYLVAHLGYSWDTVHEEAERLEHAVSDLLIERMARVLGDPLEDPHGDPIPGADGSMAELVYTPLAEVDVGEEAEIRRVNTGHPERLRYIAGFGLMPGVRVTVTDRQPFDGPVAITCAGQQHVLGAEIARVLLCAKPGTRP